MKPHFQIIPISATAAESLCQLDKADLEAINAERMHVDQKPGYPCRLSLQDAEIGEEVILWHYEHHSVESPYRASGPIFVRVNAQRAELKVDEIPEMLQHRLLSLRAYDQAGMILDSKVCPGTELQSVIIHFFERSEIEYLQIHNAGHGCYNCQVERVA